MEITLYLAQLWGPVLVVMGIGFFTSRAYYLKVYRDLEKNVLAGLLLGAVAFAAGIAQILAHNVWQNLPEMIISLLGWGMMIKGAVFLIAPNFVDRAADRFADMKLLSAAGTALILLGAYLSYIGYLV